MAASPTQEVTASQRRRAPGPAQVPEEGTQMAAPRRDLTTGHPSTTQEHPMAPARTHAELHRAEELTHRSALWSPDFLLGRRSKTSVDLLDVTLTPSSDRPPPGPSCLGEECPARTHPLKGPPRVPCERDAGSRFLLNTNTNLKGRARYGLEK